MQFAGYKRPDGRYGIRNRVLILPASVCASDTCRMISEQVKGTVTFDNQSGCAQSPMDMQITLDTVAGFAANPNIYGTIAVSLGCDDLSIDILKAAISERTNKPLETLVTCPQRLDFHPEGNVMNHTLLVVDLAALCRQKTSWPLAFMWSALLHDIGKPLVTTPEGKAPGHNESGVQVFNQYFNHFFENKKIKKYIKTMIYYHMHLMNMVRNQSKDYSYYKLLKGIEGIFPLRDLVCMSKCDKLGRLANRPETISTLDAYVEEKVSRLGKHALKPIIDGKILIDLGFQPNDEFKELLDWAYDLQMRGHDFESIIKLLKGRQNGR